jgi:hypothetical protein
VVLRTYRCDQAHEAGPEGDATIGIGRRLPLEMLTLAGMFMAFTTKELHIESVD